MPVDFCLLSSLCQAFPPGSRLCHSVGLFVVWFVGSVGWWCLSWGVLAFSQVLVLLGDPCVIIVDLWSLW